MQQYTHSAADTQYENRASNGSALTVPWRGKQKYRFSNHAQAKSFRITFLSIIIM